MPATIDDLIGSHKLLHYDASDAASMFSDTGGTSAATNGGSVKCWKPNGTSLLSDWVTEATNPPTYRSDYSGSGYPAIEFDGTNDVLRNASTGLSTGQALYYIFCSTWIGAAGTMFNRGTAAWLRMYCSATSQGLQDSVFGISNATSANARSVVSVLNRSTATIVASLSGSIAHGSSQVPATLNSSVHFGALLGSSQFGNFALHEAILIHDNAEWGNVIRVSRLVRDKWGITDTQNNAVALASSGGSRLVGPSGLVGRSY